MQIEDAIQIFPQLVQGKHFQEADEAAYNIISLVGISIPSFIFDYLDSRTADESWIEKAPLAGLAMGLLMSKITGDRESQGVAFQFFFSCTGSSDATVAGRASFHIAELMLQDPNPSQLLRTRIEASLRRAIELRHPEAAMLLGTLYGLGKLSDDGLPEPEKSASLYIKVIEEFKVPSAKRLLLEVMERHDITVPGYDLATLRGETRLH